jgi:DnaJ homolog subfamily C member 2
MSLVFGSAPSSSSQTRAIAASINFFAERSDALPYGQEALKRLGGVVKVADDGKGNGIDDFPEERIVIPVGITPQTLKNYTLYDILGLGGDLGDSAHSEVIKKAYHKAVLIYHPDKVQHKRPDGKEDRSVFLKVQEAFNVLSNETKRRAYDSQLPFDETVPSEEKIQKGIAKGAYKFFKMYDPVFKRNARFAVKKPVPELGDMNTPINDVYRFYEYWINYESWRDFTGVNAEHKIDDAMSRDEKRYYMKENEAQAKKLKKKEMNRIIGMVMLAEKYDPRITADKEKKRLAKEAEKEAKEADVKNRAELDAASKAWAQKEEDEAKAREGAPLTKADKEKLKKNESKARNTFRKLLRTSATLGHGSGEYGIVSEQDVEILCGNCSLDEVNLMNNALGGEPAVKDSALYTAGGAGDVLAMLERMKEKANQGVDDERIAKEAKRRETLEAAVTKKKSAPAPGTVVPDRDWTAEELAVISNALLRYPASTANRWVLITNYVNDKILPADGVPPAVMSVSQDEILRAAYKLRNP